MGANNEWRLSPFDRQHIKQSGNGDDFVRLLVHLRLREHQTLARGEGRDNVNGILAAFALDRREVLPSMAMTSSGALVSAPTLVTKQFRKAFRVERGEDIAQVIGARRAVGERQKAT